MIAEPRAWRNPLLVGAGRRWCLVPGVRPYAACGPVLACAGRWRAGWLGVGRGRGSGAWLWWALVAAGGRWWLVAVGSGCAGGPGVLYARVCARVRVRALFILHPGGILKVTRNF